MEHIPGKQNKIPDALSRNKPIPNDLQYKCIQKIDTTQSVQLAANLCRDIIIKNKHL